MIELDDRVLIESIALSANTRLHELQSFDGNLAHLSLDGNNFGKTGHIKDAIHLWRDIDQRHRSFGGTHLLVRDQNRSQTETGNLVALTEIKYETIDPIELHFAIERGRGRRVEFSNHRNRKRVVSSLSCNIHLFRNYQNYSIKLNRASTCGVQTLATPPQQQSNLITELGVDQTVSLRPSRARFLPRFSPPFREGKTTRKAERTWPCWQRGEKYCWRQTQ